MADVITVFIGVIFGLAIGGAVYFVMFRIFWNLGGLIGRACRKDFDYPRPRRYRSFREGNECEDDQRSSN